MSVPLISANERLLVSCSKIDNRDGCLPILVTWSHATGTCLNWMLYVGHSQQSTFNYQLPRASASILFHSSGLSWSLAAAMFSSRCASDDVPGIGNMTGDFCSNHASASCTTLTLTRFASASKALPALLN